MADPISTDIDAAFLEPDVGKQAGIMIWRIEAMEPKRQDPSKNGQFHEGDAYLVLASTADEDNATKLNHDIYFWLGKDCTQDESGAAAYKAVELDFALGGIAAQHREIQASESDAFLHNFKVVEYLGGGVDSAFEHVERDVWPIRLLQLKGKRTVRVFDKEVTTASLCKDDVFILDNGLTLYVWYGENANKYEKAKCLEVVTSINDDTRGGRADIVRMNDDPNVPEFWELLGGYTEDIADGEPDSIVEDYPPNKLYRVIDGETSEVPLENGRLEKSMLKTEDAFVIVSQGDVFIWVGKGCNLQEKKGASATAIEFIKKEGMSEHTNMLRVSESFEPHKFKAAFAVWEMISFKRASQVAAATEEEEIDVGQLMSSASRKSVRMSMSVVGDGNGKVEQFLIRDFKPELEPKEMHGQFFRGDSYIIVYTFQKNNKESAIIYYWIGSTSTVDETGSAALLATQMDDERFGGNATQVRVNCMKEPAHFRSIFNGSMVIHSGGHKSMAGNSTEEDTMDADGTSLFHVKGTSAQNTLCVQVEEEAASLNSNDCFVLVTPDHVYSWIGKASSPSEKETASVVSQRLADTAFGKGGRDVIETPEGEETDEFWGHIGGKGDYMSDEVETESMARPARLFEATTIKGAFGVREVERFIQEDLCNDDIYVLDTHHELFLWIGGAAAEEKKRKSNEIAKKFQDYHKADGRDADMSIITVAAGNESELFTQHFCAWDDELFTKNVFKDPYAARVEAAKAEQAEKDAEILGSNPTPVAEAAPAISEADIVAGTYTAEQLRSKPAGIVATKKEMYLSDEEFSTIFNMSRDEFTGMAAWKQKSAKQKVGLF